MNKETNNEPFIFEYKTIFPAISIISLCNSLNNVSKYKWLEQLCILFNKNMKTDKYQINIDDLNNPDVWFSKIFNNTILKYNKSFINNPKEWGPYIWSLVHLISLFWTTESNDNIVYLHLWTFKTPTFALKK